VLVFGEARIGQKALKRIIKPQGTLRYACGDHHHDYIMTERAVMEGVN